MGLRIPQIRLPQFTPEELMQYQAIMGMAPAELQDAAFNAPLEEGAGRKTTGEASVTGQTQGKTTRAVGDEELLKAIERMQMFPGLERQRDDLGVVRQAIGALGKDHLAKEKTGQNINLAPIAGLLDSWYGGKLSQTYANPADQRKAEMLKLGQLAAQMEGQISNEEIALLKAQLTDSDSDLYKALFGVARTAQEGTAGQAMSPLGLLNLALSKDRFEHAKEQDAIAQENREEDKAAKKDEKATAEIERLVKDTGSVAELQGYFESLDEILKKYEGKKDLPGIGGVDSRTPSWINAMREGLFGDEAAGDAEQIKTIVRDIVAMRNRQLSGLQSTDKEFARAMQNLGTSIGQPEHVMLQALRRVQNAARTALKRREAALSDYAREKYRAGDAYIDPDSLRYRLGGADVLPPEPPASDGDVEARARQKLEELKAKRGK